MIDRDKLLEECGYSSDSENIFLKDYEDWLEESLMCSNHRQPQWPESIAVGPEEFIETIKKQIGYKAKRREITQLSVTYSLNEPHNGYRTVFNA